MKLQPFTKKWLLSTFVLLMLVIIVIPLLWWNMRSSLPSGLYVEKQVGSVGVEMGEHEWGLEFALPVQWKKASPWEDIPILDEITLLNSYGDIIASVRGKFPLKVEVNKDNLLTERLISGEIELSINGERILDDRGFTLRTPLSSTIQASYFPHELRLSFNGEQMIFPMKGSYKIFPIIETMTDYRPSAWHVEGMMVHQDEGSNITKGYIVKLQGPKGSTLKDILFWLPGMTNEYYSNHVLYSLDENWDRYDFDQFEGEPLSLALTIKSNNLLVYFPITDEIRTNINKTIVHVRPYFTFLDEDNIEYYTGGSGSVGPFEDGISKEELLIAPQN
ncbi:hypothetical protein ACSVDA_16295 [Cytobacillus sp. Hm23]